MRQQNEQINNPKELIIQKLATANPLRSYTTRIAKMEDKEQLMALINSACINIFLYVSCCFNAFNR